MSNFSFNTLRYPFAPPASTVDDYFGWLVADPYRWLEDLDDPRTKEWLKAQHELTQNFFQNSQIKTTQTAIHQRLKTLWNYPKYSVLAKEGDYYFLWGLDLAPQKHTQNQAILYRFDSLEAEPVPILDPNQLDPTGHTCVSGQSFSPDGQLLAYVLSTGGSDWQEVRIRNTLTLAEYPETLTDCKMTGVAWKHDNSGFFYNRFSSALEKPHLEYSCLFWHTLGTSQAEDHLIFSLPLPHTANQLSLYPQISDDGCYLVLHISAGTEPSNRIYYRNIESEGSFIPLLDDNEARYLFLGNQGPVFYFQTDLHAPLGKVMAINTLFPQAENWQTVIKEETAVLDFGIIASGRLVLAYLYQAYHYLKLYRLNGTFEQDLKLPLAGSITGLTGKAYQEEIFFSFENFTCPPTVYRYDFTKDQLSSVIRPAFDHKAEAYETRQVFYSAKDGTFISMFLTHQKGLTLDGTNPTLLYGYGGFGKSLTPSFWLSQQVWLEQGGVLAVANIRGGGEYGQEWHEAARLGNRQNAIDDFCLAAQWLVQNGYTIPARLGIMGASNGGLLVAACAVQQPQLFGAVICQVPLADMLRYQHFGPGRAWIAEYGEANQSPEEFEWLYAYSPLHNVREATYPATLITVSLADERVHPMHGLKFAATLQSLDRGTSPILLRLDFDNGHGLGKPASQVVEELADIYTFLFQTLKLEIDLESEAQFSSAPSASKAAR